MHAQAEAGSAARLEDPARLVRVEGALLAEDVDPARVRPAGLEHLAADELDVFVRAALVFGRHRVGPEEGDVVGELAGHGARAPLGLRLEPVARLDLEVRDPGPERLGAAGAGEPAELVLGGVAGRGGGDPDPGRRVRPARHAGGELVGAIPGEDDVRVAVHEARDDAAPGRIESLVAGRARPFDRGDRVALDHERGVADEPKRPLAQLRLAGDEETDVVDDEAQPVTARIASSSSRGTSIAV